jgi:hypothetical protein
VRTEQAQKSWTPPCQRNVQPASVFEVITGSCCNVLLPVFRHLLRTMPPALAALLSVALLASSNSLTDVTTRRSHEEATTAGLSRILDSRRWRFQGSPPRRPPTDPEALSAYTRHGRIPMVDKFVDDTLGGAGRRIRFSRRHVDQAVSGGQKLMGG